MSLAPDVERNHGEILDLPVAEIGPGPLVRAERVDQAHAELLRPMLDEVPPVVVRETAGGWTLIDGQHRLTAAKLEGRSTVRAVVVSLTDAEALEAAVKANTSHGKALTLSERKAAAVLLLEQTDWSDRRISAACGLHRVTVGKCRPEVTGGRNRPPVTGRDGKTYTSPGVEAARKRREAEASQDQAPPAKCSGGHKCALEAGSDGLCSYHRGKARQASTPATPAAGAEGGQHREGGPDQHPDAEAPSAPGAVPSPETRAAEYRARISPQIVAVRRFLENDPAEMESLMSAEDTQSWCELVDDLAQFAHEFNQARSERRKLRSVN